MATYDDLARLGAGLPADLLRDQSDAFLALMEVHDNVFASVGWKSPQVEETRQFSLAVDQRLAEQKGAREERSESSVTLEEATLAAKEWKADLVDWVAVAFMDKPKIRDAFHPRGTIGTTTSLLVDYLVQVVPLVQTHAEALANVGAPADYAAQGKSHEDFLRLANAEAERDLQSIPPATKALNAAKGELYNHLRKFVRHARIARRRLPKEAPHVAFDILRRRRAR